MEDRERRVTGSPGDESVVNPLEAEAGSGVVEVRIGMLADGAKANCGPAIGSRPGGLRWGTAGSRLGRSRLGGVFS